MDFFKNWNFFKYGNESPSYKFPDQNGELTNNQSHSKKEYVFSDSIRLHQFFENEVNEIMKLFGFNRFDSFFSDFSNSDHEQNDIQPNQSLRDHFLKDGYQTLKPGNSDKVDEDLDERVKFGNFGSILDKRSISDVQPYDEQKQGSFFRSQKQTFRKMINPDGIIQTESSVKDSEGNEETTVCQKLGIKEYCIIRKRNKHGEEEIKENLINMTEDEKEKLFKLTFSE